MNEARPGSDLRIIGCPVVDDLEAFQLLGFSDRNQFPVCIAERIQGRWQGVLLLLQGIEGLCLLIQQ